MAKKDIVVEWLDEVFELTLRKKRNSRTAKIKERSPKAKENA